jgi:hypothetical protein
MAEFLGCVTRRMRIIIQPFYGESQVRVDTRSGFRLKNNYYPVKVISLPGQLWSPGNYQIKKPPVIPGGFLQIKG